MSMAFSVAFSCPWIRAILTRTRPENSSDSLFGEIGLLPGMPTATGRGSLLSWLGADIILRGPGQKVVESGGELSSSSSSSSSSYLERGYGVSGLGFSFA